MKNISPLNFTKYLSYSEVQKNKDVVNNWNRFKQLTFICLVYGYQLIQNRSMGSFWQFVIVRNEGNQIFLVRKGYW